MTQADSKRYLNLEAELTKRVIGQDEAVSVISRAILSNPVRYSYWKTSDWFLCSLGSLVLVRQNWLRHYGSSLMMSRFASL